ncbi:MAG: hypothetical protein ACJ8E3_07555 [Sphingomicrobium sp.]
MMQGISIYGVLTLAAGSSDDADRRLRQLAAALGERFDRVHVAGDAVSASTSWRALVFRGRRTHPMLPFDEARVVVTRDGSIPKLHYQLSIKGQVLAYTWLGLAAGVLASIERTLPKGMLLGGGFAFGVFLLNFLISSSRAKKWIEERWTGTGC